MQGIHLQLILTAYLVNFVLSSILSRSQAVDQAVPTGKNGGIETQGNVQNLFNSIAKNDSGRSEIYRKILKQDAAKERQTFKAMNEELHAAQDNHALKKVTFITDTVILNKRDTNKHTYKFDFDEKFNLEIRPYSSHEVDEFEKQGLLKKYFHCAMRTMAEQKRINDIFGFICAAALIRWANKNEYNVAQEEKPGDDCANTWLRYIRSSKRRTAQALRGAGGDPPLLKEALFKNLAQAQCRSYPVFSKHVREESPTVMVLSQLREGSNKTIIEMLQEEQPKFLLSADEMDLVNIYTEASGSKPFPYLTFRKENRVFAIPQLRSTDDTRVCASRFCR